MAKSQVEEKRGKKRKIDDEEKSEELEKVITESSEEEQVEEELDSIAEDVDESESEQLETKVPSPAIHQAYVSETGTAGPSRSISRLLHGNTYRRVWRRFRCSSQGLLTCKRE
jgi:hypothetical protein